MSKLKLYLFFALTIVINNCCLVNNSYAANKPTTILVMGDSLSAGYGIKLEQGWVNLLQQQLAKINPDTKIINASVSGETSSGGLARLPALLIKHHPNIVILELGGNDGLRGQPLKLLQQNLQSMIDSSIREGADVLLIGMQIPPNYGSRYTKEFKETYPVLAEKNKLLLVPFLLEGVAGNPELIQNDGIHPKAEAQPQLAKNVAPILAKMFK
jgi:acyl-CoA thioesterase-1